MDDEDKFFLEVDAELQKMIDTDNASQLRGLRDRFAMAALSMVMEIHGGLGGPVSRSTVAADAYAIADAMLAERAK